ncbi:MAG: hypothetical protein J6R34_00730, partial [Clostridia bacterium]|nr:hypothetical protein [Clostridia bacterium]
MRINKLYTSISRKSICFSKTKKALNRVPFYLILEDYFLSLIAACAAASLAIGTLKGEQLT